MTPIGEVIQELYDGPHATPHTEDTLLQQTTADYLEQQLGWRSAVAWNHEDFGPDSLLGPGSDREVAGKILTAFGETCKVHGETLRIAPSIGIAVYPEDGEDDEQLIRCADDAMYRVKRSSGNRYGGTGMILAHHDR